MYGNFPTCEKCVTSLSDVEVLGHYFCDSCMNTKRLEAWQKSARERGLYDMPKNPRIRVNDRRAYKPNDDAPDWFKEVYEKKNAAKV